MGNIDEMVSWKVQSDAPHKQTSNDTRDHLQLNSGMPKTFINALADWFSWKIEMSQFSSSRPSVARRYSIGVFGHSRRKKLMSRRSLGCSCSQPGCDGKGLRKSAEPLAKTH